MPREGSTAGEPIKTIARVIAVQRNKSIQRMQQDFRLQHAHFRFLSPGPEFPVQISAGDRIARSGFEPARIAHWIQEQAVALPNVRLFFHQMNKIETGIGAVRFIPVNTREQSNANWLSARTRTYVEITWE